MASQPDAPATPIRSLQVTMRDRAGERFNGYRLHRALRERGHRSQVLTLHKSTGDPDVHDFTPLGGWLEHGLYAAERVTSLQGMLSPFGAALPFRSCFREAEVVHWHLVYPHFIGIPWVPMAARLRPTVWTLHDPWATTGHCVHPLDCPRWQIGCGHCPDLKRNFTVWFDTTALVWRAKRAAYRKAPLTLVVASGWMRERVRRSPLLAEFPCHVIPFGLDLDTWAPPDRDACRERLGIGRDERVLAFRLPPRGKHQLTKGGPWLIEALERLRVEPATLIVLESRGELEALRSRYRILEPGWIEDERRLAEHLAAADLFLMPSPAESFGFMALEAMACGTPVIACDGTAVAELVRAPEAGVTVPARDPEALAHAIEELLGQPDRRATMGGAGRRRVEADFRFDGYVRAHETLYRQMADARRGAGPAR